jgi:NADH-quinone oxidoreductase subunit D
MTRNQAEVMGVVGPTARASGVTRDVRVDAPYAAYDRFPVMRIVETAGDLEARFIVRIRELFECYRLIRHLLDHLPTGEIRGRMPRRVPQGETISRVEAPRGELFYFLKSNGTDTPERVKVRTPTIYNLTSVVKLVIGHQLADVPMILAGIDPCFSCNDRTVRLEETNGRTYHWTWDQLRRYSLEGEDGRSL